MHSRWTRFFGRLSITSLDMAIDFSALFEPDICFMSTKIWCIESGNIYLSKMNTSAGCCYIFYILSVFVSVFAEDLPAYNCSIPLNATSTCHHYLPYDTTSTATHIQTLLNHSTENLLSALTASQCYNMSQMFVCATRYPTCQTNGFPLLPCRHVCQCKS